MIRCRKGGIRDVFDIIIKGKIVTADRVVDGCIGIKDEKIEKIFGREEKFSAKKIIDVKNSYIFPGFIDTHAHLNDPGYTWREDYAHGTAAAAVGGYTTILDMPLQNNPSLTNMRAFEQKKDAVKGQAYVDYCFWGGLIPDNLNELKDLKEKGCKFFKAFIGPVSSDYSSMNYGQAYEAMMILQKLNARAGFHCEDYTIIKHLEKRMREERKTTWSSYLEARPVVAELIATEAVIEMAKKTGCKIHICHVSSPEAAEKVRQAQKEGYDVTAETCAHYLSMTEEDVLQNGELFKCAPPLRVKEDVEQLWEYVKDGTFSGIASDHSPCTWEEKYKEILGKKIENVFDVWGGISGIQSSVQTAFYEGVIKRGIAPEILADVMVAKPAKAFGLYGKKGDIKEGFDADLTIIDPNRKWKIKKESLLYVNKISAYIGKEGTGMPVLTMVRGNIVAENGKLLCDKKIGKLIIPN